MCKSSCGKGWKSYFLLPTEQMKEKKNVSDTHKEEVSLILERSIICKFLFFSNFQKLIHLCTEQNVTLRITEQYAVLQYSK